MEYSNLTRSSLFVLGIITLTQASPAFPQAGESSGMLEEIIVTARKRDESLLEVPISVSVFSGDTIEKLNIKNVEDTFGAVPGLYFTGNLLAPTQNFRQLVIRGVGANSQLEPSVATVLDGVYVPSIAFDMNFMDIERVEILKGPQGALFGRNTEGGVLNIVTRKPSEESYGKFSVLYDEFNTAQLAASFSGPLSAENSLYGKASVMYRHTDGFITNNTSIASNNVAVNVTDTPFSRPFGHSSIARRNMDESDTFAISGALRWAPSDSFEANFVVDYSEFDGGDQAPGPQADCECYVVNSDVQFDHDSENYGASLTLDWVTPLGALTSITGWREIESSTPFDMDGVVYSPVDPNSPRIGNIHDFDFEQSIFSEELRLASDGDGPLNWLVGLYYFDEGNLSDRWYNFPNTDDPNGAAPQQALDGLWNQQLVDLDRSGYALFGQVSFDLSDRTELTVGGRYSDETVKVAALEAFAIPGANFGLPFDYTSLFVGWPDFSTPFRDKESWNNFSPTASIKFNLTDDVMTYFTWSQGFKAGSYQKAPVAPTDVLPIDPEEITNYEAGLKGAFADRRVILDASVYHLDIDDMQLQSAIISDGLITSAITNASSARVNGAELSLTALPVDQLTLSGSIGWTDTEFKDYVITPDGVNVVDRSGDDFPNTPEFTFFASAEYRWPIGSRDMELVAYSSYRYVDDTYAGSNSVSVDPILPVPDWHQLDLQLSLQNDRWRATVFADNVTDEYIVLTRWNPFFIEPNLSYVKNRVAPPRRVGVSLTYRF
jgi:iron complex outermembrane receptor protein